MGCGGRKSTRELERRDSGLSDNNLKVPKNADFLLQILQELGAEPTTVNLFHCAGLAGGFMDCQVHFSETPTAELFV